MRRILILSTVLTLLTGCGSTGTKPNTNQVNSGATSTNTGGTAGAGPHNQGIGGGAPVNGNSRVEPPGAGTSGSTNSNK